MSRGRTSSPVASKNGQHRRFHPQTRLDRRSQRTQNQLRDALAALIREKPYEEITVKEILDRANIGRSTFYTHFRDKDELLVSSIEGMVQTLESTALRRSNVWHERILWFSRPIFEYHSRHRHGSALAIDGRAKAIHRERLQEVLSGMIGDAVGSELRTRKLPAGASRELLAQYLAGTFVLVLDWWVDCKKPPLPQEADALFRSLVLRTLSALR